MIRMNAKPRLTIGLPVYNGEDYLAQSLDAVLGQTFEDFILVISDNASTDGTTEISREYMRRDPRVQYVRHPVNLGAAGNHNFLAWECRTEFFKWVSADDLYARDLIQRCIDALDEFPEVVLAHSWTAAMNGNDQITQAHKYPLATDSSSAPERFRSMLFGGSDPHREGPGDDFGTIQADDFYGVIRTNVLQRIAPHASYYYADRTFMSELALNGPFHQTPEFLYFRRDHPDRAQHANPTVRSRCINLDPKRSNRWKNPAPRLMAEYLLGYVGIIRRAPLSSAERRACYRHLTEWLVGRGIPSALQTWRTESSRRPLTSPEPPSIDIHALVAGRS